MDEQGTPTQLCAYCVREPGTEEDHVFARQFFPNEERFRSGLPKVPSCPECNREKQRAEDGPAVWLQFGDGSEGANRVARERVPRTLAKNLRLTREFRERTKEVWAAEPSGMVVKRLALELGPRELGDLHKLFMFIIRGLFRYETGEPLPAEQTIFLIRPTTESHYKRIAHSIRRTREHKVQRLADGELKYMFSVSPNEPLSSWLIAFRSLDLAAVTVGEGCPILLREYLELSAWSPADE